MSSSILRVTLLAGVAAITLVAFTGSATSASERSLAPAAKIVYHSRLSRNNEIFVAKADGTGVLRLTRSSASDSNPTWSADGKRIAFESNRHRNRRSYQDSDLFIMTASGGSVRELTFSNRFDGDPAWSRTNQDRVRERAERRGRRLRDQSRRQQRAAADRLACVRRRSGLVTGRKADRVHQRA